MAIMTKRLREFRTIVEEEGGRVLELKPAKGSHYKALVARPDGSTFTHTVAAAGAIKFHQPANQRAEIRRRLQTQCSTAAVLPSPDVSSSITNRLKEHGIKRVISQHWPEQRRPRRGTVPDTQDKGNPVPSDTSCRDDDCIPTKEVLERGTICLDVGSGAGLNIASPTQEPQTMLDQTKTTRRGAPIGGKQQHLNFLQKHQVMKILEGYCRTGDDGFAIYDKDWTDERMAQFATDALGYPVTAQNVAGLRVRAIGKFPHARQLHGERGELEARVAKLEATVARLATLLD